MTGLTRAAGTLRHASRPRRLTLAPATALAISVGLLGALLDVARGAPVATLFALGFAIGCAMATAQVRRADILATVVMPPLAFAAMVVTAGILIHTGGLATWLVTAFVIKAPVVWLATAAAALVAAARHPRRR